MAVARPPRVRVAFGLFAALLVVYNANGREMGTVDSQPEKYLAREIAVRHTLALDAVVAQLPGLAERPAFARDREGHERPAYPVVPGIIAAAPALLLQTTGLVDMDAPLAPNLVAVLTASMLTAAGVVLVYLTLLRIVTPGVALLTAIGLGLGTNLWTLASRTLWQHETVIFGLALALWAWLRSREDRRPIDPWLAGAGLALAGAARPQVAPIVAALLVGMASRDGLRALRPAAVVALAAAGEIALNYHWFGQLLGGVSQLEAAHPMVHAVAGSMSRTPWIGAAGLLVSPSRGLLIFSPVVLTVAAGASAAWRRGTEQRWLLVAAALQFAAYSCYTVWWGGHTYGPRYMLDLLVPLAPAGAIGAARLAAVRPLAIAAWALLAWSIAVAGVGAFVYPNEAWNTSPAEVDRHHERLWDPLDSQIARAFTSAPSPQNFDLFSRAAIRRPGQ